jgi:reactive intermediate/imine deaminase
MTTFTTISSQNAPAAIGTYSQAVNYGGVVYLSGQIPLVPETMELVSDDFSEQINQVFSNLLAVCQAAGGDFNSILKLTIYLTDLANFSIVNEVMAKYFTAPYPARAAVQVSALPRSAQVEIDGIMASPE